MKFIYNDGGRAEAGFKGKTGDCCCRAIAIATGMPYKQAYALINEYAKRERVGTRKRGVSNARTGVYNSTLKKIMTDLGWSWVATMQIGSGCRVHLREDELPKGRIIARVARHFCAVIDGVLHDTWDSQQDGDVCVYGYYIKK